MNSTLWAKAHGAATHLPLALIATSVALDGAALALGPRTLARELRHAGFWTMQLGALGAVGAVFSGLFLSKGEVLGHGALRLHHIFVWPAFALAIALALWRAVLRDQVAPRWFAVYVGGSAVAAGLMLGAGYWGGELLLAN